MSSLKGKEIVGFIGGGMMAESIIKGILGKKVLDNEDILVSEPFDKRRKYLEENLRIGVTTDTKDIITKCNIVILAVKPHIVPLVMPVITKLETEKTVLVSICAGVKITSLKAGNADRKVIRVMPNQPCVVGEAASAISVSKECQPSEVEIVKELLNACGMVEELPEYLLDAVTGLSGSGPAFVFMMIEAMSDAGVKEGLPRTVARQLAAQTVYGSAKMLLEEPEVAPAEFRNRVESPAGTTITGSCVLEERGFRAAVMGAVSAAKERAVELGKQ